MSDEPNQYARRDLLALDRAGNHFCRHVGAMTREGLHSKHDIAAELAWRDSEIARLTSELAEANERIQEYDVWLRAEEAEAGERARVLYLSSSHDENAKRAYHTSKRYADGLSHARIRLLQLVKFPLPPTRYTILDGNSADVTGTLLDLLAAGPTWTQADVLAVRALGVGARHQFSQHDGIWIRRDE